MCLAHVGQCCQAGHFCHVSGLTLNEGCCLGPEPPRVPGGEGPGLPTWPSGGAPRSAPSPLSTGALWCSAGMGGSLPCLPPSSLQFGERFEFDCKDCVCLEGGSGIVCEPKKCSQKPLTKCTEDGTYLVTEVDPADTCCNITSCSKAALGAGASQCSGPGTGAPPGAPMHALLCP